MILVHRIIGFSFCFVFGFNETDHHTNTDTFYCLLIYIQKSIDKAHLNPAFFSLSLFRHKNDRGLTVVTKQKSPSNIRFSLLLYIGLMATMIITPYITLTFIASWGNAKVTNNCIHESALHHAVFFVKRQRKSQ